MTERRYNNFKIYNIILHEFLDIKVDFKFLKFKNII